MIPGFINVRVRREEKVLSLAINLNGLKGENLNVIDMSRDSRVCFSTTAEEKPKVRALKC